MPPPQGTGRGGADRIPRARQHGPALASRWPAEGPPKLWEAFLAGAVGDCYGSPSVADGRVYMNIMDWMGTTQSCDSVVCLDAATGRLLWKKAFNLDKPRVRGTASTPCIWKGRVYGGLSKRMIYCLDALTGKEVWTNQDYGGGHASVLVEDGVVVSTGAGRLVALDAETGAPLWKGPDVNSDYSPALWRHEGKTYAITSRGNGPQVLRCNELATGKELWTCLAICHTVAVEGDTLAALDYKAKSAITNRWMKGRLAIYKLSSSKPEKIGDVDLADVASCPILCNGYVYYEACSRLVCVEARTGVVKWSEPVECGGTGVGISGRIWSSPVMEDGKLFAVLDHAKNGHPDGGGSEPIGMFDADPEHFEALGVVDAKMQGCTSPAVAGTRLFVHTATGIACFDLSPGAKAVTTVSATIDNGADGSAVSPLIYGIAQAGDAVAKALNVSTRRMGGNAISAWDWKKGFWSSGADWYFVNNPKDETKARGMENNWWLSFHRSNKALNIVSYPTLPMMGRVARDGTSVAFDIDKYPDQTDWEGKSHPNDMHPKAGNGKRRVKSADGKEHEERLIPNPYDTSVAMTPEQQVELLRYCVTTGKLGRAKEGGIRYIALDNEPSLWNSTHYGMHPEPLSYDELWERTKTYGTLLKDIDPDVQLAGMAAWGWSEYWYSARDVQLIATQPDRYSWKAPPDKATHGDLPLTQWFLRQCAQYEKTTGRRLIDIIDWHFYPQAKSWGKVNDPQAMEDRVQETRVLWDPTFKDSSWMGAETGNVLQIIRLLKRWIAEEYPGTKTCIGEYNFCGPDDAGNGVAMAEVLGVYAREGLDMAYFWFAPGTNDAAGCGFRLLRNPDGKETAVGERYLPVTVSAPDDISVHPYKAKDGRLSLLVLNKRQGPTRKVRVNLAQPVSKQEASAWRYTNGAARQLLPEKVHVEGTALTLDLPAISATRVDIEP